MFVQKSRLLKKYLERKKFDDMFLFFYALIYPLSKFGGNRTNSPGVLALFILKFPWNERSDRLKQRALSKNRERIIDIKLAFKFLLRNFDKFDPAQAT